MYAKNKMTRKANVVPAAIEVNSEEEDDESDHELRLDGSDSDEELQNAFARGELTGLNTVLPYAKKENVNNVAAMKAKFDEIRSTFPWIERLDVISEPVKPTAEFNAKYGDISLKVNKKGEVSNEEKEDGAQHDFKREMLFYRQAQSAVLDAIPKLHKLSVVTKRPVDYFAQMLKSDTHMKKVREVLVNKHESMEKSERAKKQRELKKLGKQIQVEVIKKRAKDKREMLDRVNKFKKGKTSKLDIEGPARKKSGKEKKAEYKESKYGFGGQKKRGKYNTAESSADYGEGKKGRAGGPNNARKGAQRPGKTRRAQQKLKNRKK